MKQLYILIFVLPLTIFAQCPPTGGIFTSQAQIDALAVDYPDCTEVNGFSISGDDITDLSGLYQINSCTSFGIGPTLILENTIGLNSNLVIRYVEGTGTSFGISNNASLLTINGLENLEDQSGFESNFAVSNNPVLISLQGLPYSFNAMAWMSITNNDALVNLVGIGDINGFEGTNITDNDGLIDLTGLGNQHAERLRISNNSSLQSLDGSEMTGFADYLYIEDNPSLTDISAIYAGDWLVFDLIIRNNPNLSMCSTENVCNFIASNIEEYEMLRGTFENNAPGCNNVFEVEYGCGVNSNDDCGYAPNPLMVGDSVTANNEYATTSSRTPSCNDIANRKDVWFAINSEDSTTLDIFVQSGFYLQLWEGYCSELMQVDNACGTQQLTDIVVTTDTRYYIQVWNDDTTEDRGGSSWFDLTVQDGALSTSESVLQEFKMFPNPTNGLLNFESNLPVDSINVYNVLGQNVMSLNSDTRTINMSNLESGMYFVQLEIEGKTTTHKVLKQ